VLKVAGEFGEHDLELGEACRFPRGAVRRGAALRVRDLAGRLILEGLGFKPRRFAEVSRARGEVCYALFKEGVSFSEIGRFLNKDHTSIRTAVAKHADYLERRNRNGGSGDTGGDGDISLYNDGGSS